MNNITRLRPAAVDANGSLPKGVKVYEFGKAPTTGKPRNLLETASLCDDRNFAISLIHAVLKIESTELAEATLVTPHQWAQLPPVARLQVMGDWLRAECFQLMDFVEHKAINTIGD
jgi:hypothetical protein